MARIAVIGAGTGAMAAAARLAVAGHRVVVYERTATYGGALGRFERDGFSFDTGPGLLPLPAVWRDLFVKTGKEPLESCVELVQVDPSARHVFADGTEVALPNASRAGVLAALDAALGADAGRRWGDFLVRARETWDRTRRPLLEEPLWPNWEVLAEREPYPAVPHKRLLRTRRAGTLAEVGAWELRDARLAALLESHALAHGLDPGPPRPTPRCCRTWSTRSACGTCAVAVCGSWPGRCTSGVWPAGSSSASAPRSRGSSRRTAGWRAWSWPRAASPRPSSSSRGWRPGCWSACAAAHRCGVTGRSRRGATGRAG